MSDSEKQKKSHAEEVVQRLTEQREKMQARMDSYTFKWPNFLFLWVLVLAFVLFIAYSEYASELHEPLFWFVSIPASAVGAGVFYACVLLYLRFVFRMIARQLDFQLAGADVEKLQDTLEDDFFNKLVKINFKYIDQYYLQTQSQANKSFVLTSIVAGIGVAIILAGIVMMYLGKTEPAYVTTAAGVLSEFIAGVFFYLYNRTIIKMSEYHQKLVLTQNIGLALKITEELPAEDRIESQKILIDRLSEKINIHLSGKFQSK